MDEVRRKGLTKVDQVMVDCELSPSSYEKITGLS